MRNTAECTCRTEQYYFGGPVYVWRKKTCPLHGSSNRDSAKSPVFAGPIDFDPAKPFTCILCGQQFVTEQSLTFHVRDKHQEAKP